MRNGLMCSFHYGDLGITEANIKSLPSTLEAPRSSKLDDFWDQQSVSCSASSSSYGTAPLAERTSSWFRKRPLERLVKDIRHMEQTLRHTLKQGQITAAFVHLHAS